MSVEVKPLGVKCNLDCTYCYQKGLRKDSKDKTIPDFERIASKIRALDKPFALFGGEILLLPLDKLRELLAEGFRRHGRNTIQTNGTLVQPQHVELFKEFNVHVGISVDGPGALNDARKIGSIAKTRLYTARSHATIDTLLSMGIKTGLIVTLHRINASKDVLPNLIDWFAELDSKGLKLARLHLLERDNVETERELTLRQQDQIEALQALYQAEMTYLNLRFDMFREIRRLLEGSDERASCVWKACDPYSTPAVQSILPDGSLGNCDRTSKGDVGYLKSEDVSYDRYLTLHRTPQEHGGCSGCRFFAMCKGQCPGTGIDRDWRNRSVDCETWKAVFGWIEAEMVDTMTTPLSLSHRRSTVETLLVRGWEIGQAFPLKLCVELAGALMRETPKDAA